MLYGMAEGVQGHKGCGKRDAAGDLPGVVAVLAKKDEVAVSDAGGVGEEQSGKTAGSRDSNRSVGAGGEFVERKVAGELLCWVGALVGVGELGVGGTVIAAL